MAKTDGDQYDWSDGETSSKKSCDGLTLEDKPSGYETESDVSCENQNGMYILQIAFLIP